MGVYLYCQKTKHGLSLGTGGFERFRCRVAEQVSPELGEHYKRLRTTFNWTDKDMDDYDQKTLELLKQTGASIKVFDFLYQSDISGRIRYGACKEILKVLKDYDDPYIYGYVGLPGSPRFCDIRNLLQECVDNKCNLVWK